MGWRVRNPFHPWAPWAERHFGSLGNHCLQWVAKSSSESRALGGWPCPVEGAGRWAAAGWGNELPGKTERTSAIHALMSFKLTCLGGSSWGFFPIFIGLFRFVLFFNLPRNCQNFTTIWKSEFQGINAIRKQNPYIKFMYEVSLVRSVLPPKWYLIHSILLSISDFFFPLWGLSLEKEPWTFRIGNTVEHCIISVGGTIELGVQLLIIFPFHNGTGSPFSPAESRNGFWKCKILGLRGFFFPSFLRTWFSPFSPGTIAMPIEAVASL